MKQVTNTYAVEFTLRDGSTFLVQEENEGPKLFYFKKNACEYRDSIKPILGQKVRVVKVKSTHVW